MGPQKRSMKFSRVVCVLLLCTVFAAMCEAKTRVKVFERGNWNKWPQAIVINNDWGNFVAQTRQRLQLPAGSYPVLKFYDSEDFEMQNPEEVDDNQYVFVDTSGQEVAPALTGGALAHVPREHFKSPNTKIHVWNYPAGETAETPIAANVQTMVEQLQAQLASMPDQSSARRAEITQLLAQLNQRMDQAAASRKYAEAAQIQQQHDTLSAELKSL